ncbi:MAG: DUF192 domain-containing protein [Candidatus Pacebacteria bacterium]|nr:DUF192 domain-containing protein [Candidatus Paceibacterota bacterium]
MKKILVLFATQGLFLVLLFFLFTANEEKKDFTIELRIGNATLSTEVASTQAARTKGLSGRAELSPADGMLFIFDKPDTYGFWMKGMNFPIDIIWIGEGKKVVSIKENALPESFPKTFYPSEKVLYVLETNAGFVREQEISLGNIAEFSFSQ